MAQGQVLGDGAAAGDAREERDRDGDACAHEQRTPGAGAQAPAREGEHGGRAPPPRAPVRAGSAVRGGGGLLHVGRAPKDTGIAVEPHGLADPYHPSTSSNPSRG